MEANDRLVALLNAAKNELGSDKAIAEILECKPQVVSDWRHGRKHPSIEAQADLAAISGVDITKVVMFALIENAKGARKMRFQNLAQGLQRRAVDALRNSYITSALVGYWRAFRLNPRRTP